MGWLKVDRLTEVEPTDFDVGVVFVVRCGNRIVARRGEVLETGRVDAQGIAAIRVAAVRSMLNICCDREVIPIAREVAWFKRGDVDIAVLVEVGNGEAAKQLIGAEKISRTKRRAIANRQSTPPAPRRRREEADQRLRFQKELTQVFHVHRRRQLPHQARCRFQFQGYAP